MAVDFGRAVDAAFTAFGIAALHRPKGGEPVTACTIVWTRPDDLLELGAAGKAVGTNGATADVRASEIASPIEGDAFDVSAADGSTATWIVRGPPRRDPEQLTWRMRLARQA